MKLTKEQLKKLIIENLVLNEVAPLYFAGVGAMAFAGWLFGKTYKMTRVNNEESIQDHVGLAAELQRNYKRYQQIFKDLADFAVDCQDTALQAEITKFVDVGAVLSDLIPGFNFDMSDAISAFAEAAHAKTAYAGAAAAAKSAGKIRLSKKPVAMAKSGGRIAGSALAALFLAYDVYDAENIISKVENRVDLNRLADDMQGFENLHRQLKLGKLPCIMPDGTRIK